MQYGNSSDASANSTDDRLSVALTLRYPAANLAQPEQAAMRTIYKQCALHQPRGCDHDCVVLCQCHRMYHLLGGQDTHMVF